MDTFQRDDLPQGNVFLIVASRHLLLLSHLIVCHLNDRSGRPASLCGHNTTYGCNGANNFTNS